MYKIIKDGTVLAMTEAPNYIKRQENGYFSLCGAEDAEGIAHGGVVFHLLGRPDIEGAAGTVMLEATDAGGTLAEILLAVDDLTVAALMGGVGNV